MKVVTITKVILIGALIGIILMCGLSYLLDGTFDLLHNVMIACIVSGVFWLQYYLIFKEKNR